MITASVMKELKPMIHHTEKSQLTRIVNQLIGFYKMDCWTETVKDPLTLTQIADINFILIIPRANQLAVLKYL